MRAQLTLTVPEGKRLIARAIAALPEVQRALAHGRILLKGGTTVSALAEELVGIPLRISGRISPRGTKSAWADDPAPHSILIEGGSWRSVDEDFGAVVAGMGRDDVAVLGANAIDVHGNAAMMAGRALGGVPGQALAGLMAQGVQVIIACGLEKLIPGSIAEAVASAGMAACDWSLGMAVGLMPVHGRLITEKEALQILADVRCTVIGRGGIDGAEGGTTLVCEGEPDRVQKAIDAVLAVKGARTSGSELSRSECRAGHRRCREHRSCVWRRWGKKGWGMWE